MQHKEFVEITGIPNRTILNWTQAGLVLPAVQTMYSGQRREYDDRCVLEVKAIRRLYAVGLAFWKIKEIMNNTRGNLCEEMDIKLEDNAVLHIKI